MSFIERNDGDRRRLTDDDARSATYGRSDTRFCRGDLDEGGRRRTMTVPPGLDATQGIHVVRCENTPQWPLATRPVPPAIQH